jgi:hypothetical protein
MVYSKDRINDREEEGFTSMTNTMTAPSIIQTLAKTFAEIKHQAPGSPWVPLGNFMMDFFRNHPELQADLLSDPIQEQPQIPAPDASFQEKEAYQWAVFCAASAEYLAHKYHLDCPSWANDPAYHCLSEPWYFLPMAYKKEQVRQRTIMTTPEEFARRNIYCGGKIYVDKYAEAQKFVASSEVRKTA